MKATAESRYGPVVLECSSATDPTKKPYEVRRRDGHYTCNCKGWIFCKGQNLKHNGDKRCRHTDAAEKIDDADFMLRKSPASPTGILLDKVLAVYPGVIAEVFKKNMLKVLECELELMGVKRARFELQNVTSEPVKTGAIRRITLDD